MMTKRFRVKFKISYVMMVADTERLIMKYARDNNLIVTKDSQHDSNLPWGSSFIFWEPS